MRTGPQGLQHGARKQPLQPHQAVRTPAEPCERPLQAVPLGASAATAEGSHSPSAYEWSEQLSDGTLLAVGGGAPSTVHLWNLQQELCMEQAGPACSLPASPQAAPNPCRKEGSAAAPGGAAHQQSVHGHRTGLGWCQTQSGLCVCVQKLTAVSNPGFHQR